MSSPVIATAFFGECDARPELVAGLVLGFNVGLGLAMRRPELCFALHRHLAEPQIAQTVDDMTAQLVKRVHRAALADAAKLVAA